MSASLVDDNGHALFSGAEDLSRAIQDLWTRGPDGEEERREVLRQLSRLSTVAVPDSLRDRALGSAFLASAQLQIEARDWDAAVVDLHEAGRTSMAAEQARLWLPRVEALRTEVRRGQALTVLQALGTEEIQARRNQDAGREASRLESALQRVLENFASSLSEGVTPLQAWQESVSHGDATILRAFEASVHEQGLYEILRQASNPNLSQSDWEESLLRLAQEWTVCGRLTAASLLAQDLQRHAAPFAAHGASELMDQIPAERRRAEILSTLQNLALVTAPSTHDLLHTGAQMAAFAYGEGLAAAATEQLGLFAASRGIPALERSVAEFLTHNTVMGATVPLMTRGSEPLTLDGYLDEFARMFALSAALGIQGSLMRPAQEAMEGVAFLRSANSSTGLNLAGRTLARGLDYGSTLGGLSFLNLMEHPEDAQLGGGWLLLDSLSQDLPMRSGRLLSGAFSAVSRSLQSFFRPERTALVEPPIAGLSEATLDRIEAGVKSFVDPLREASGLMPTFLRNLTAEGILHRLESPSFEDNAVALQVLSVYYSVFRMTPAASRIEARAGEFLTGSDRHLQDWSRTWVWSNLLRFPPQQRAIYLMEFADLAQVSDLGNISLRDSVATAALSNLPAGLRQRVARHLIARLGDTNLSPIVRYFSLEVSQHATFLRNLVSEAEATQTWRNLNEVLNYSGPQEERLVFQLLEQSIDRVPARYVDDLVRFLRWQRTNMTPAELVNLSNRIMERYSREPESIGEHGDEFVMMSCERLGTRAALPLLLRFSEFTQGTAEYRARDVSEILERYFLLHTRESGPGSNRLPFSDLWSALVSQLGSEDPVLRRRTLTLMRAGIPAVIQSGGSLAISMELSLLDSPYPEVSQGVGEILTEIARQRELLSRAHR